ncbi:MAG: hypothetical protein ACI4AD_09795 [Roseburia sp.]
MSFSNRFLMDFEPVFLGILQQKGFPPEQLRLEIIDEEPESQSIFEPVDVLGVLEQISENLNFLQIYTERPAYFSGFAETMYEENGLLVTLVPKRELKYRRRNREAQPVTLLLDFEWEGSIYRPEMGVHYVPIHKRPWGTAENLDIAVPIGYNTVIVKRVKRAEKETVRDRFEMAFYGIEP